MAYDSSSTSAFENQGTIPKNTNMLHGFLKFLLLLLAPSILIGCFFLFFSKQSKKQIYDTSNNVIFSFPMKNVNWQDLGMVFEPIITIPVKTQAGYEKWDFLIDSGALISSLPREWSQKTGKDLAFLKRSTFKGFGGKISFAYQGEMMLLIGNEEKILPVVFTESEGTKSLLGRKGFFEEYSVYFNHNSQEIEIRK